MIEEQEITGPELTVTGVPEGWVIDRRKGPDWDVYILVKDTPLTHARKKLLEVQRIASEALDVLNSVEDDGSW